jgi:hypothetical protein
VADFGTFCPKLPSNVSKTEDLRHKERECLAIWGVGGCCPLAVNSGSPFSKYLDPPLQSINFFQEMNKRSRSSTEKMKGGRDFIIFFFSMSVTFSILDLD